MNQRHCDVCDRVLNYQTGVSFLRVTTELRTEFDQLSDCLNWDVCDDCVAKHPLLQEWSNECHATVKGEG